MGFLLAVIRKPSYNAIMTPPRVIGPLNKVITMMTTSANERRTREAASGSR